MNQPREPSSLTRRYDAIVLRYLGYALLFGFAAFLLFRVRDALPVFVLAAFIAYALEPVLQRLEQRGHSRYSAVGFIFLIFLLVFCLLLALLASAWQQVQSLSANAATYQQDISQIIERGRSHLDDLHLPESVKASIDEGILNSQQTILRQIPTRLQNVVEWTIGSLGSLAIFTVVLPVLTFWFMLEMNPLRARLLMLFPDGLRDDVTKIGRDINELLGRYVRGQMLICSTYGVLCTIAFQILHFSFGMDYGLVLGMTAAFIYLVPYLGMATIATSAGLTAYFTSTEPVLCAVLAVGCCILFNLVLDYGVAPRVLGKGTGLHPMLVIFALLSGFQLGGVLGMILAVPFFASLRVVALHIFPQLSQPIPQQPPEVRHTPDKADEVIVEQTRKAEDAAAANEAKSVEALPLEEPVA